MLQPAPPKNPWGRSLMCRVIESNRRPHKKGSNRKLKLSVEMAFRQVIHAFVPRGKC